MILKFGSLEIKLNETSDGNVRVEAAMGDNKVNQKISPEEANTLAAGLKEVAALAKRRRR